MSTEFPRRWATGEGYEYLLGKMDGAPYDGFYAAKIGFDTELTLLLPPTLQKSVVTQEGLILAECELPPSFVGRSKQYIPRAFKIAQKLTPRARPYTLLSTADESILIKAIVLDALHFVPRTVRLEYADADTIWYVYKGGGYIHTTLGTLEYKQGDFIYIPAQICHSFTSTSVESKTIMVGIESMASFTKSTRSVFENKNVPFTDSVVSVPRPISQHPKPAYAQDILDGADDVNCYYVYVKIDREWIRATYPYSPFQCVAWDGTVYPFIVNREDLRFAYTTSEHPDPSNFAVFSNANLSAVISVLGSRFVHSIPYNHKNGYEEFLFYAKEYEARKGSMVGEGGDATLHPKGLWHGPQPKALRAWKRPESEKDIPFVEECAIMFESKTPFLTCKDGLDIAVSGYETSWSEDWEEYQELQKEEK